MEIHNYQRQELALIMKHMLKSKSNNSFIRSTHNGQSFHTNIFVEQKVRELPLFDKLFNKEVFVDSLTLNSLVNLFKEVSDLGFMDTKLSYSWVKGEGHSIELSGDGYLLVKFILSKEKISQVHLLGEDMNFTESSFKTVMDISKSLISKENINNYYSQKKEEGIHKVSLFQ